MNSIMLRLNLKGIEGKWAFFRSLISVAVSTHQCYIQNSFVISGIILRLLYILSLLYLLEKVWYVFTQNKTGLFPLTLRAPNKNCSRHFIIFLILSFEENMAWFFMWFTWNIKSYFLWKTMKYWKTMKKYLWMSSAAVVICALRINK